VVEIVETVENVTPDTLTSAHTAFPTGLIKKQTTNGYAGSAKKDGTDEIR